ncbi:MAG: aldo/keto reductase [Sulfurospirillaceae bacterium]|nr:aldo/keto reductase [Sulfurospirillaceae bacterium]
MKYNYFGKSGLLVSELCFGTMTFGGSRGGFWELIGKVQQEEVNNIIKIAFESGINFFDTANIYSFGESENLLGQAIKDLKINRDELVIASKVRGKMSDNPNSSGLSRYHIFNSVDESLQRLQLDHLDILYVHGVDENTDVEDIMRSLNDIVMSGKVRYIAVCNWPAWMVMKANAIASAKGWHKFIAMQYYYSLATRDIEREIMPLALDQKLAVLPWSPLAGGFLSGKYKRQSDQEGDSRRANFDFPPIDKEKTFDILDIVGDIAVKKGVSVAQIALAWVRVQNGVTSTIIGAKKAEQLLDNIDSLEIVFSDEELKRLDEASALKVEYPEWMIERGKEADAK